MINAPQLPPKAGYVEVEVDGQRRYRNVLTGLLAGEEPAPEPTAEEQRLTDIEAALMELAGIVGGQ